MQQKPNQQQSGNDMNKKPGQQSDQGQGNKQQQQGNNPKQPQHGNQPGQQNNPESGRQQQQGGKFDESGRRQSIDENNK